MKRVVVFCAGLTWLGSLMGCGPLISSYLIVSAQADLDGARAAEAEKFAVYEYTAARAYLQKAREEQGYSDFGPSIDFAYKARDLAQKAMARSDDEKRKRSTTPAVEWEAPGQEPPAAQPRVRVKIPAPSPKKAPRAELRRSLGVANEGAEGDRATTPSPGVGAQGAAGAGTGRADGNAEDAPSTDVGGQGDDADKADAGRADAADDADNADDEAKPDSNDDGR